MAASDLSASNQEYLKTIWNLQEWSDDPVTLGALAARVGVRLSTASDAVRRLTARELVKHTRYGSITLTAAGRAAAVSLVRKHRLLETFLSEVLGYSWDQVHDEANALEHVVSDYMMERVDTLLNHPERDPHGDPIPRADGTLPPAHLIPLEALAVGVRARVERVSDADSELLRRLAEDGLQPGAQVTVLPASPFSQTVALMVGREGSEVHLERSACAALWVSMPENTAAPA